MKKLWSHIMPVQLKKYHSSISGDIEINLMNGKRTIDTITSNYSFGTLQKILSKGLERIQFNADSANDILVLGMGGASVLHSIRNEFNSTASVDLVEIDEIMIHIAKTEFNIDLYKPFNIYHIDALKFVVECQKKYDVIIIDIFIIDKVPIEFTENTFISKVSSLLSYRGKIIFNTMRDTMSKETRNSILSSFKKAHLHAEIYENVNYTNDLIIISV